MNQRRIVVLYIDDDPDIRAIVEMALEMEPEIELHAHGPDIRIVESIRQLQPDLVLLDVMMPGIDGISIAQTIHTDSQLSHIPFAFMTAKAMPQELAQLHALGARGIISKPFDPLKLAGEIRAVLEPGRS